MKKRSTVVTGGTPSPWKDRFVGYLKDDPIAFRMFRKLIQTGFDREYVLSVLEHQTDPSLGFRLRRLFEKYSPVRRNTRRLAANCKNLEWEIKKVYGSPFGVAFPEAADALALANDLGKRAVQFETQNHTRILAKWTLKSFWKRMPLAVLCEGLNIPRSLSWEELHPLYRLAKLGHGQSLRVSPKGLAAAHRRFMRSHPEADNIIRVTVALNPQLHQTPFSKSALVSPRHSKVRSNLQQ